MALAVFSLAGCKDDFDEYDNSWLHDNAETMTLEASSNSIKLDANDPEAVALTMKWTPAREMSDEYVLSYVTMLDLKTNQFNASSVVRTLEDDGVFERSYTHGELQSLITEKWSKSISEVTTLSFKVIAKWEGGDKYVMPEVRTVDVDVKPFRPIVFDADKVFLDGEAVKAIRPSSNYTVSKTPENEFIHAGEFLMKAGRMTIPIEYDGATRYICPATKQTAQVADNAPADKPEGIEFDATVMDVPEGGSEDNLPAWNLAADGFWRVIVDMENKTVKFFSPKNRLEPMTVDFQYAGNSGWILKQTLGQQTYYLNSMTGWDGWKGKPFDFVQSQIDPQLLILQGVSVTVSADGEIKLSDGSKKKVAQICIKTGLSLKDGYTVVTEGTGKGENDPTITSGMKFVSKTLAFAPQVKETPISMNQWIPMTVTVTNNKWISESPIKICKITVDLRNSRIRFD